jgi:hypothetical protein
MQDEAAQLVEYEVNMDAVTLRNLQEASDAKGAVEVAYVSTPGELQAALAAGAPHIQIQEHLDLTTLDAFDMDTSEKYTMARLDVGSEVLSIRVRPASGYVKNHHWQSMYVCIQAVYRIRVVEFVADCLTPTESVTAAFELTRTQANRSVNL